MIRVKRLALCVAAILLACAAIGCSGTGNQHFADANRYLKAGKTARAKQAMESAVKEAPDRYKAVKIAVAIYAINKKDAEAEQLLVRMLNDQKKLLGRRLDKFEQIEVLLELNNLLYEQGRIHEGIEPMEQAYRLMPDHYVMQNALAYTYAEAGIKLKQALVLAQKAHDAAPDNGTVTDTLGWVHYKLGNYDQAKLFLHLSVKQTSDSAEIRYHLGIVYAKLGERTRAWIELKKALCGDPTMSKARKELRNLTTPT